jgi:1,5-anhydro-D-fructose reductase (1,5-anhydro-D-mannitol-forming)
MQIVRWGIVGCGDVTEVKSGPGFSKAEGSELVAVMRRDVSLAEDYALRHGVPRFYGSADDLIMDASVDAVYVSTPPSSHRELAMKAAEVGKPCLVEKPMALNLGECEDMVKVFNAKGLPLFVAYYRRALPRFLRVRDLLKSGTIGTLSSVHIVQYGRLDTGEITKGWRYDPTISGGGLFLDLGSHGLDLLDFLIGPIESVGGFSVNTGGSYRAEDVTAAGFVFESGAVGTGVWNFNADHTEDRITFTGSEGELQTPVFTDGDITINRGGNLDVEAFRNPPHVHQPLIQTIVDQLAGTGSCESTGESGTRTGWVMSECLRSFYGDE